jgi:hypothetical protein
MPRFRIKRIVIGLALTLLLLAAGSGYVLWRLSWQSPSWFAPPNPNEPRVASVADDAEYLLLEQTQKIRPAAEQWTLRITQQQINAWLATRLPQWIEHDADMHWPEQIGTPQVLIEPDGLRLAVPVSGGGVESARAVRRVVVATLKPAITADGALALPLTRISLGKVWVPGEPLGRLTDALRQAAPEFLGDPRVQNAIDVLAGRKTLPPEYVLTDGRRVVLTGVKLGEGAIELTARTASGGKTGGQ